jgi:hypothetical protein
LVEARVRVRAKGSSCRVVPVKRALRTPNGKQTARGSARRDIIKLIKTTWWKLANKRVIEVVFFSLLKASNRTTTLLDFIIKGKTLIL